MLKKHGKGAHEILRLCGTKSPLSLKENAEPIAFTEETPEETGLSLTGNDNRRVLLWASWPSTHDARCA